MSKVALTVNCERLTQISQVAFRNLTFLSWDQSLLLSIQDTGTTLGLCHLSGLLKYQLCYSFWHISLKNDIFFCIYSFTLRLKSIRRNLLVTSGRSSPPFQTFLKFLSKLRCGADHLWQLGLRLVFWMNFSFVAAFAKIFNWMVIPLSDLLERRASPVRVLRAYRLQYFLALPVPC